MATYTYTDTSNAIDFVKAATREEAVALGNAGSGQSDIIFCKGTGSIFMGGDEYGAGNDGTYDVDDSIDTTTKVATKIGGITTDMTAKNLEGKSISEILDLMLFPEGEANAGSGSNTNGIISPASTCIELGAKIPTYTVSAPTTSKTCSYVYNETSKKYEVFNYSIATTTTPVVTIKNSSNTTVSAESTSTWSTYTYHSDTTQSLTTPSTLRDSKYLYKSRGTATTVQPTAAGTVGYNNGTVYTYVPLTASGQVSSSYYALSNGKYYTGTTASSVGTQLTSIKVLTDTGSDITFSGDITETVYTMSATQPTISIQLYNAGSGKWQDNANYTVTKTSETASSNGVSYTKYKYVIVFDADGACPNGGRVNFSITF